MNLKLRIVLLVNALLLPQLCIAEATTKLEQAVSLREDAINAQQQVQEQINTLASVTDDLTAQYRLVLEELANVQAYNAQMQRIVDSQESEKQAIRNDLDGLLNTERGLLPLMLRMIDHMEAFIAEDAPFLLGERVARVAGLRALMDRGDVTIAEKYRRILEAYQIELDFGRSLESYVDEIEIDGKSISVNFLRVGRLGLYYQKLDESASGMWQSKTKTWTTLSSDRDRLEIAKAIRIAKRQAAPDLLQLPLNTNR